MFRVHHSVLCRLFLPVIHRSAWNMDSANFSLTGFSEVGIAPVQHLWASRTRF